MTLSFISLSSLPSNQPSPKQQASPLMKVKPPQRDSSSLQTQLSNSSKASSSVTTSTVVGGERGGANIFSPSQSQDSFVESGLSPDTSDTGDHSAESIETEPMEVDIRKGSAHLGKRRERERDRENVHATYTIVQVHVIQCLIPLRSAGGIVRYFVVLCESFHPV